MKDCTEFHTHTAHTKKKVWLYPKNMDNFFVRPFPSSTLKTMPQNDSNKNISYCKKMRSNINIRHCNILKGQFTTLVTLPMN